MNKEECESREHPHNQRCRYTTGFYCEDCEQFFARDSPTYIRYELPVNLWMVTHNIGVEVSRAGKPKPPEIDQLCDALHGLEKNGNVQEREMILNKALVFVALFGKTKDSASLALHPRS